MNFNRKLKTLAVALVAATASQMSFASLLHVNPGTGNGSFFFVAANDEGDSFIQSLANLNGNFRMDSATPITEQDFTLGASLASVIAGSNPVWTVIAGDSTSVLGQGKYTNLRLNVGITPDTSMSIDGPASMRNALMLQSLQLLDSFLSDVDSSTLPTVAGTGVYDPNATGQPTDIANFVKVGPGFTLFHAPTEGALLSIGATLDAWLLESNPKLDDVFQAQRFAALTQLGQWRFDGPTLHYGVIPAAPVPVPAAVWLLGSALAGMTGLRRRKA